MSSIFKWNCKYRKNVKEEKFRNYFKYQSPSPLVKHLFKANKNKNDKIKYMIINELTKLMKDILKMKIQKSSQSNWKNP